MSFGERSVYQALLRFTFDRLHTFKAFLETLYLFTANDFLTFAMPTTLFASFGALSGSVLTTNSNPSLLQVICRSPVALLVVWANLLVFDISNQRSPAAIAEDKINKPHRPLPSGRITTEASRRLLLVGIPLVLALGWLLNCWQETLLLFTATWMYNDLQGCDEDWVLRNFLIAVGYGLYSSAALRVIVGPDHTVISKGIQWIIIVTTVMFITQHICDIKDAEGDRVRGRRSAPIVLGDELVRWSVAIPVLFCSVACTLFFELGVRSYAFTLGLGCLVAGRLLLWRDLKSDKLTWKLWALWTVGIFALPLIRDPDVLINSCSSLWHQICRDEGCTGSLDLIAISGVAVAVGGKRLYAQFGLDAYQLLNNVTVPGILVEEIVL